MGTVLQKEQVQLLKALADPKLKALLTELLKHVQRQEQKDSGCG